MSESGYQRNVAPRPLTPLAWQWMDARSDTISRIGQADMGSIAVHAQDRWRQFDFTTGNRAEQQVALGTHVQHAFLALQPVDGRIYMNPKPDDILLFVAGDTLA